MMVCGPKAAWWNGWAENGVEWWSRVLCPATLALAMFCTALCGALCQRADATAPGVSAVPSSTEPYAVCPPPTSERAECTAILNPASALPVPPAMGATQVGSASAASSGATAEQTCFSGSEHEQCASGYGHGFTPQDLQSAYRLPSATAGAGQKVAIVDPYDDPNAQADLNVYRATYDLPPCESGCFTKVNQEGKTSSYPKADPGWSHEMSIDLDMVSAACPNCQILLVEANNNMPETLGAAVNEAVVLGATEISNSYGSREIEVGKKQKEGDTKYYRHPGVPITAAGGDHQYENKNGRLEEQGKCVNCSPNYPAGLESVISVGGTHLQPEGEGRGWSESVWWLSGSGCAVFVAKPPWQTDKGCGNRTTNDVSAEAASETPVSLYDTYAQLVPGWQTAGGTSVATPLVAGAIALESSTLRAEGSEGIYKHPANWFDVTKGENALPDICPPEPYLCNGEVGYDAPSGMGTPDGGATTTPPSAVTEAASNVTKTSATLNGIVNAEGSTAKYYFQYGGSTAYGKQAPLGGAKVTGYTTPEPVSQTLSNLDPAAAYHFRVVTVSAGGTTYGPDRTFSTAAKVYQWKFGYPGSGNGALKGPQSAAADVFGDVWVSDYANNRIEEFSPTGAFIRACGSTGAGGGQFDGPTGIAVNPTSDQYYGGDVYVSDSANNRIEVFTPECKFVVAFGAYGAGEGQLSGPMGLAFGIANNPYEFAPSVLMVADSGNNRIEALGWSKVPPHKAGEFLASFGSKGSGEGQFLAPTGVVFMGVEGYRSETFAVVDSGNDRVQMVEEAEASPYHHLPIIKYLRQFGSKGTGAGQFTNPTGVVFDPTTGEVDVSDTGDNRVEQFLPNGTYVAKFGVASSGGEGFAAPAGLGVNASGDLYVADSSNNRIAVWGPSAESPPEWQITPSPNPSGASSSFMYGDSCPSSAMCAAVGYYIESNVYKSLAEVWNGSEWQLALPPTPSGSTRTFLYGVSCTSSTACEAVGYYLNASGAYRSLAESWNGKEWQIQSTPEPSGATGSILSGVSCTSSTACTASGWYENSTAAEAPFAERWNGTAWSVQSAPNPTGAKEAFPYGVSCASSTACMMAGYYVNGSGTNVPFGESWNGSEWTLKSMPSPAEAKGISVPNVSCASSTACTAAAFYVNNAGAVVPFVEAWNGTEWSIQTVPDPSGAKSAYLHGVACTSATACIASGDFVNSAGKYVPLAESWDGTEWESRPAPSGEHEEASELNGGAACAAHNWCMAVGGANAKTLAEVYR